MLLYIENVPRCARKFLGDDTTENIDFQRRKVALQWYKNIFKNTSALDHCNEAEKVWEEKACFNIRYLKVRRKEAGPDVEI